MSENPLCRDPPLSLSLLACRKTITVMGPTTPPSRNRRPLLLPDLSRAHIQFLDREFPTGEALLSRGPPLLADLSARCAVLDDAVSSLRDRLPGLAATWISRSFAAKSSLSRINRRVEDISLRTSSPGGVGSRSNGMSLEEEMRLIAKQVRQIESIRKYIDTALKLEASVGDLEDTVFCFGSRQLGTMPSVKGLTLQLPVDFGKKQERFSYAIEVMNVVEEVLVDIMNCQPHWHSLVKSVDCRVDKALVLVRSQLLADHRALLASLGWPPKFLASRVDIRETVDLPNPLALVEGDKRKYYSDSFLAICALQHMQTRREYRLHGVVEQELPCMMLWSIEELVSPIATRMESHFSKWKEQPEFIFALAHKITGNFLVGLDDVLQPLIDKARLVGYSAKEAWVSAMMRMVSGFLAKEVFPPLVNRYKEKDTKLEAMSSWIYLIDNIVGFDKQMQSLITSETQFFSFGNDRLHVDSRGSSVLDIFYDRPGWLKIWAKVELKDAWKKLKSELTDEKAWSIRKDAGVDMLVGMESDQFPLSSKEAHKAPTIAQSAIKIAWKMVERCQTLPSVVLRAQFIRSTTVKFFWYFINVLVLRRKNDVFPSDNTDEDLVKISALINSAGYVNSKLQEWSDDVDFLEMRIAEKERDATPDPGNLKDSCFFREEIKSLMDLETSLLMEIIAVLLRNIEVISWDYLQNNGSFIHDEAALTSDGVTTNINEAISFSLAQALDAMRSQLQLLKTNLNPKDFLDLWRSVAEGLDHFISSSIFEYDIRFSAAGINQFRVDMRALFLVFRSFCTRPESFFPCIRETLKLLNSSTDEVKSMVAVLTNERSNSGCLLHIGISHLSFDQVYKALRNRKFDP